jgi:cyclic pyranopterin phosphate synthase
VTALDARLTDLRGRALRDLRVSVTDRCNFRCPYCMPRELFGPDHVFLPQEQVLSLDEIARLVRAFAGLGVRKLRLTGGEPLLRPGLEDLVAEIAATPGIDDVALTTNGALLAGRAQRLKDAGLHRVTVSLDSLDPAVFATLGDTKVPLSRVLDGIAAAAAAGLSPVKLNTVLQRGRNDDGLLALVEFAREHGHTLRVIEYMDVGTTNGWRSEHVVPAAEVLATVGAVHPLEPVGEPRGSQVAERWRYLDGRGELGLVSSVTRPFCGDCVRARLTATGELHTCLFSAAGFDLRTPLRAGASDDDLVELVAGRWARRDDRYSELRGSSSVDLPRPEMSYLGG